MGNLLIYLKPYRAYIALIILLLLGQALAEVYLPTLMSDIVNEGIVRSVAEDISRTYYILRVGLLMLAVALSAGLASIAAMYFSQRVAAGGARDLRRALFSKIETFSQGEFDKFSSASLITRCTNDVSQVQTVANVTARMLLYAPILAVGGIIMALSRAASMIWIIVLSIITLIGVITVAVLIVMPRFKIIQELVDKLNKITREILHGLMVIRAFGTQKHEKDRFDKVNMDLLGTGLFVARVMAVVMPCITLIMSGTQILVIWVGGHYVAESNLLIGDMIAFMQYSMQIIIAFTMISVVLIMVPRAMVSAARITEVLKTEPMIKDPMQPLMFKDSPDKGVVVFDNVRFAYPGAETDAIWDISFTAKPGQTTAIIGATGSGKSTAMHLLLRFYDVTGGKITVDGLDIRQVRQSDLRKKIGYVPQKGQLLAGTIESNIKYGNPSATSEEVEAVSKVAQALSFIEEKEDKYGSEISQGGSNVSGGQKQRLSIARALAKNPEILVFDDSFSALDFQTDANLRKALKEYAADATIIVIAQRIGTIINAEQILVLDEGRIVGRGTHTQLLKDCPAYYEIASSQGTN